MTLFVQTVKRLTNRNSILAEVALIMTGSILIAASAQIRFYLPNTPVPVTLQTLTVLLIAAVLGSWRGVAAVVTYIAAGSLGLPFFAGLKGGPITLLGPTGGYLLGFVVAAGLVGWMAKRKVYYNLLSAIPMFLAGQVVIYVFGTIWLSQFVGSISQALTVGVLPFIPGDIIKVVVGILILPTTWRIFRNQ